jgi:DNA polymerase III alpha subunit
MWTETNNLEELIQGVLRHGPGVLENSLTDADTMQKYLARLDAERLSYPKPKTKINKDLWFIPQEYQDIDIELFCLEQCKTEEEFARVAQELELYHKHKMIPVLKTMKYIVDTLRTNNIVWGVGRGSSVSSYVLFLIGIHKIDSIKYNIPIEEFFKGE